MFNSIFNWSGKIGRIKWLKGQIVSIFIAIVFGGFAGVIALENVKMALIFKTLGFVIATTISIFMDRQRLNDLNASVYWLIIPSMTYSTLQNDSIEYGLLVFGVTLVYRLALLCFRGKVAASVADSENPIR